METEDELKEIDIKNRTCYYFDDIITNRDIYSVEILLDKKVYEDISVYDILYKTSTDPKPLGIRFDKIDGFIRVGSDEFKNFVLFDHGLFDEICDKTKYLISEKKGTTDSINHNFGEIRIDSYNSLPIEKILTFLHNVIILIKLVVNKDKNDYYYNLFLEKGLYKDNFNTRYSQINVCIL